MHLQRIKQKTTPTFGFTLVEMLIVITIIGLLAGLLFPAIGSAIRSAKRAKARTEVMNLAAAFRAYYTEFGYWPTNLSETLPVTTNTFANSKGILFYDFSLRDVDMETTYYRDPWQRPYWFRVDHDYNNSIPSPFQGDGNIAAGVIVWSEGPDGANYTMKRSALANRYVITSW